MADSFPTVQRISCTDFMRPELKVTRSPCPGYNDANSTAMTPSIKMDYESLREKKWNPNEQLLKNPQSMNVVCAFLGF